LAKTCSDTLSDEPCDVLSDSDDNNAENASYDDFESQIGRNIKKTVHHLSSHSESGSAKKQDGNNKSKIYAAGGGGGGTWQKQAILPNLKIV
jgi:hypothetical protein